MSWKVQDRPELEDDLTNGTLWKAERKRMALAAELMPDVPVWTLTACGFLRPYAHVRL